MVKRLAAFAPAVVQLVCLAAVVWGVALVFVPAAFIVGGLGGVIVLELGFGEGESRRANTVRPPRAQS